jgi:hypothetical protein
MEVIKDKRCGSVSENAFVNCERRLAFSGGTNDENKGQVS